MYPRYGNKAATNDSFRPFQTISKTAETRKDDHDRESDTRNNPNHFAPPSTRSLDASDKSHLISWSSPPPCCHERDSAWATVMQTRPQTTSGPTRQRRRWQNRPQRQSSTTLRRTPSRLAQASTSSAHEWIRFCRTVRQLHNIIRVPVAVQYYIASRIPGNRCAAGQGTRKAGLGDGLRVEIWPWRTPTNRRLPDLVSLDKVSASSGFLIFCLSHFLNHFAKKWILGWGVGWFCQGASPSDLQVDV